MALDLSDCQFHGPALPEPFVKFELERELTRLKLLPKATGAEARELKDAWDVYRRKLRMLTSGGGSVRVFNHVLELLQPRLGYSRHEAADEVQTREDREDGGILLVADDGAKLRVWVTAFDEDLYAPAKRGRAYRFSHQRVAQRVLLASGERLGLLTNGVQLLVLISDPARPDSTVTIPIDPGWKGSRDVPDSFRFLLAIASPKGVAAIPELVDKARLQQARVTKELRKQARESVEHFIQEVLDYPQNQKWLAQQTDRDALAKQLWREGLITVYRLLFILKLEAGEDAARSFSFASSGLWRNTYSPSISLARYVRKVMDPPGAETGQLLEQGLRSLFRMFEQGIECTELNVKPLGGALFGPNATPILSQVAWGERAVAWLLDRLLWTAKRRGVETRERVHYGPLDVEDLGRVYEALLELEPGITSEPMCRLRRQKLEVVVPLAQGERYRPDEPIDAEVADDADDDDSSDADEEDESPRGKKTKVEWVESIPPGKFYLRVGLGRKASGSYYTPHSFVRFLVQETLGPQTAERSSSDDPQPLKILELNVLDPAMGSGHFLVEACRFLGDKLYEACRLCDEKALAAERKAEKSAGEEKERALAEAQKWRDRVIALPDPNDEILNYLPSRSPEGGESGLSQQRAAALCRRLVATHCLYGVDKNPLAVELAKLALWLESHAEGMPLTFLDHRLVIGDSLTGPFWQKLLCRPGNPSEPIEGVFSQGLSRNFATGLREAIRYVRDLEVSVGSTVAEIERKRETKVDLDRALLPFRVAAAAWSGGVMLGAEQCDDLAYADLLHSIADAGDIPEHIESSKLRDMIARGLGVDMIPPDRAGIRSILQSGKCDTALPYDLTFPEVFYPTGVPYGQQGFHAVLGNPPWDAIQFKSKEFFAAFDFEILNAPTKREREVIEDRLTADPKCGLLFEHYKELFEQQKRANDVLYKYQKVYIDGDLAGRQSDAFRVFMERNAQLLMKQGWTGVVVPSAFHANEGASGIRRLYLDSLSLRYCFSFENRRKLFEIHSSFKFATVVAQAGGPTEEFSCAFYLHDDAWLFSDRSRPESLEFERTFVDRTGGEYLAFVEPRNALDQNILVGSTARCKDLGTFLSEHKISPNTSELPMIGGGFFKATQSVTSLDPRNPEVANEILNDGFLAMHEGKTFWQFNDRWEHPPRYLASLNSLKERPRWLRLCRFYRLVYREVSCATNERTGIFCVLAPPHVTARNAASDITPWDHATKDSLILAGVGNSFPCDYFLRFFAQTHVTLFMLTRVPFPSLTPRHESMLAHSSLRLLASHAGYQALWNEQVGEHWREAGKLPMTWPVLVGEAQRWQVRAAMDAVVASAYDLSREHYVRVLSTFSHSSYANAPALCLAMFDDLKRLGLDAFIKKHDPYWDVPLNENLPQPVIDLPTRGEDSTATGNGEFRLTSTPKPKRARRK